MSIAEHVRHQFQRLPEGGVIASRALHHLASKGQQADKAASRLYKTEGLQKLRNGLYYRPYTSKYFGTLPPKETDIIKAIAQQYRANVYPSGALAAYELGLIHTLPDVISYDTDKRISPIKLDNHTLHFNQVNNKKLSSSKGPLLLLLKAMAFLFKKEGEVNGLQRKRIIRLLGYHSHAQITKALIPWPLLFRQKVQSFKLSNEQRYISGLSALNIPYQGKQADWHQMGMLHNNKFHIAFENYDSAPNIHKEELFDCSAFLNKHYIDVGTVLCAKPLRAIKDILYMNIFNRNQYPSFFMLDQFMFDVLRKPAINAIEDLMPLANKHQKQLLTKWADENDLN